MSVTAISGIAPILARMNFLGLLFLIRECVFILAAQYFSGCFTGSRHASPVLTSVFLLGTLYQQVTFGRQKKASSADLCSGLLSK